MDPTRIIPASEFVSIGRRFLGIEEPIDEVPLLRSDGCQHASRAHMPPSRRAGKPASSATTVVHALSRTFKRLSIRHQVESGAPFNADINLRIDIVIEREASEREASETLRRQSTATKRYSSTSRTQTPRRESTFMRDGGADRDGSAASTSEARKHNPYARVGQVSFDERSHKLVTRTVESFGRLGKEGSELIDQLAASIVGGTDGGPLSIKKGVCNEHIFHIVSVTTQVAISRRVHRYKLALRDRHAGGGRRGEDGGLLPMAWRWHLGAA